MMGRWAYCSPLRVDHQNRPADPSVYSLLAPHLDEEERAWLRAATNEI